MLIQSYLKKSPHRLEMVENGAEALKRIQQTDDPFDLVLMDIQMPEVSGIDASRTIRLLNADKANIPIIALTADAMEDHKIGYFEAGMNEVVTKPIDREELAIAINRAMGEEIHETTIADAPSRIEPEVVIDPEKARENEAAVDDFLKQIGIDPGP